jgi:hypothetical protein
LLADRAISQVIATKTGAQTRIFSADELEVGFITDSLAPSLFADAAGGSGFMQISLPRAALLLAQGTGRLIRSLDDRGVVAILDSRIVNKRYGSILLNSMPPFWRTNDGEVIKDALRRLDAQYLEKKD